MRVKGNLLAPSTMAIQLPFSPLPPPNVMPAPDRIRVKEA